MSRKTGIPLAILLVLVLTYPLDAWLIGIGTEHEISQQEQAVLAQLPSLSIISRSYRRGIYGAVEEITVGVHFKLPPGLTRTSTASNVAPLFELTARNTIHHGPLPQLRTFAYATVDSEIVLPPALAHTLQPILHGSAPFTARTRLGWGGGRTSVLASPAFQTTLTDGTRISWRGIGGTGEAGPQMSSTSVEVTAPGIALEKGAFSLHADQLVAQAHLHKAFETLQVGTGRLTLTRAEAKGAWPGSKDPTPRTVQLQNLAISTDSSVHGDYLDTGASLTLQGLSAGEFSASNIAYEFALRHLHGPTYAQFTTDLQAASRAGYAEGANPSESLRLLTEVWRKDGVELLLHEPVLELSRVAFTMPEGQMLISARLAAPGIRREELQGAPAAMMLGLVPHLEATADLRIDAELLSRFLNQSKNGSAVAAQVEAFERQGYLKRDGKALTTHITFEHGQLQVNGQPFKPGAH
jgi:uncharacterized protein YdgA (DUF945 family)